MKWPNGMLAGLFNSKLNSKSTNTNLKNLVCLTGRSCLSDLLLLSAIFKCDLNHQCSKTALSLNDDLFHLQTHM